MFIPATVEELDDECLAKTKKLKNITISPLNKNIKYLDDDNKIIVRKSDPKEDVFDTIIFANRDIERAIIPNHIKYIKNVSFKNYKHLKTIEISEDSQIVTFPDDLFTHSSIEYLFIPKGVEEIEDRWCSESKNLTKVKISPLNKNSNISKDDDNKIIVGKSDPKEDVFDTIIFANRDIEREIILKHIKYIKKCSFEHCERLKKIEFSKDSELISIGFYAFSSTAIKEELKYKLNFFLYLYHKNKA